jgi:hypothetical protein
MSDQPAPPPDSDRISYDSQLRALKHIYRDFRIIEMNERYYASRQETARNRIRIFDILIFLGSSSGGIAGLSLWKTDWGFYVWATIATISTVLAGIKPIMGYAKTVARCAKLTGEYAVVSQKLYGLITIIRTDGIMTSSQRTSHRRLMSKVEGMANECDPNPNRKLLESSRTEVDTQYPPTHFWLPRFSEFLAHPKRSEVA